MDIKSAGLPGLPPRAQEDYGLVCEAVNGNQKAYATLMNRYQPFIYRQMFNRVFNRVDADDLTMEAFGKAFNRLETYSPSFPFVTWLHRIAINNYIDFVRKKRAEVYTFDNEHVRDHLDGMMVGGTPEDAMIREQRIALTRSTIQCLPEKYQVLLRMRYYEDLSYEEMARNLDLPLGTVKAQLFRAKNLLAQKLQKPMTSAY